MNNTEEFFRAPAWEDLIKKIREEVLQLHRPADEVILDEVDFCSLLKISKRTAATLRAKKVVPYYKLRGKLLYKLSDVLTTIEQNKIDSYTSKSRIK